MVNTNCLYAEVAAPYITIRYFPKPTVDLKCDRCNGVLYQREDDRPEVIRERLRVYEGRTQPLIKYYEEKRTRFITVENNQVDAPIENIFQKIRQEVNSILKYSGNEFNLAFLRI
jgi:adenylate kinase family enzyme